MELNEIKSVLEKQGGELKAAIEKYEGQLSTTGTVASEAKDAVRASVSYTHLTLPTNREV